jgi:UDP-glucuronate decarboxylase
MHPNDGRVVSNFIVQALTGQSITIYGDGTQTRSFCYVDDLIDGLTRLMEVQEGVSGPINLGNPVEISIKELAALIAEMTNSASPILYRPLPADDPIQRCPDITRACKVLGWQPKVPLREGLERTVAYFRGLIDEYVTPPATLPIFGGIPSLRVRRPQVG